MKSRNLNSKNDALKEKYLKKSEKDFETFQIFQQIRYLKSLPMLTEEHEELLNHIDEQEMKLPLEAEDTPHVRITKVSFLARIHRRLKRYWRKILHLAVYSATPNSLAELNPYHVKYNITTPFTEIQNHLREIGRKVVYTEKGIRTETGTTRRASKERNCLRRNNRGSSAETYSCTSKRQEISCRVCDPMKKTRVKWKEVGPSIQVTADYTEVYNMWILFNEELVNSEKIKWRDLSNPDEFGD